MSPFNFLRPLTPDEYAGLKADIAANGQRFAIIRDQNGVTIDGHHRERALAELGMAAAIETQSFATDDDRIAFVISANHHRRQSTAEDRKRLATYLYDGGKRTMEAVATILGVNKATISRDLDLIVAPSNNQPRAKSPTNPRGAGRPKAAPKPQPRPADSPGPAAKAEPPPPPEPKAPLPPRVAGIDVRTAPAVWEAFRERAHEAGVSPTEKVAALIEAAVTAVPMPALSASKQEQFDAALRAHKRKLDLEYQDRKTAEIEAHINSYILPLYREKMKEAETIVKSRKGAFSADQFKTILRCLHPDNSAGAETRAEAFRLWNNPAIKLILVGERDNPTNPAPALPRSFAESLARKEKVKAERKAERERKAGARAS